MNAQWQYKPVLGGYNNVHVLELEIESFTLQRNQRNKEGKRDMYLRPFAMKGQ